MFPLYNVYQPPSAPPLSATRVRLDWCPSIYPSDLYMLASDIQAIDLSFATSQPDWKTMESYVQIKKRSVFFVTM